MRKVTYLLLIGSILLNVWLITVVYFQEDEEKYLETIDDVYFNWGYYQKNISLHNFEEYQEPLARITRVWTNHLPNSTSAEQQKLEKLRHDFSIEVSDPEEKRRQLNLYKQTLKLSEIHGQKEPFYYNKKALEKFLNEYMEIRKTLGFKG